METTGMTNVDRCLMYDVTKIYDSVGIFSTLGDGMTSVDVENFVSVFTKFRHGLQILQSTVAVDIVDANFGKQV